jgi:hypothetical protein
LRLQTAVQRWSVVGYLIGLSIVIVSAIFLSLAIERQKAFAETATEGIVRSLPLFGGVLICIVSLLCIASNHAKDFIYNQGAAPLPDTEEGITSKHGATEWMALGMVDIAADYTIANSSNSTHSLIRCLDYICGGRTRISEKKSRLS